MCQQELLPLFSWKLSLDINYMKLHCTLEPNWSVFLYLSGEWCGPEWADPGGGSVTAQGHAHGRSGGVAGFTAGGGLPSSRSGMFFPSLRLFFFFHSFVLSKFPTSRFPPLIISLLPYLPLFYFLSSSMHCWVQVVGVRLCCCCHSCTKKIKIKKIIRKESPEAIAVLSCHFLD